VTAGGWHAAQRSAAQHSIAYQGTSQTNHTKSADLPPVVVVLDIFGVLVVLLLFGTDPFARRASVAGLSRCLGLVYF